MDSEKIALAKTSEKASWYICLLANIPLWKTITVVLVHNDSTAAIAKKIENR